MPVHNVLAIVLLGFVVAPVFVAGFKDLLTFFGSYHNQDYSLFYGGIRQNAIDRVNAFAGK
jgi:hypothetical protein